MTQPHTASPGQIIPSAGTNDNFTALSDGTGMTDDNSLLLYRNEMFGGFCTTTSGLLWSVVSGLQGAMAGGNLYLTVSGLLRRITIAAISSKTFTASKDTYVSFNGSGSVNYDEQTNGASRPTPASGYTQIAKIVTDGSGITSITSYVQRGGSHGREIGRTQAVTTLTNLEVEQLPAYKYLYIMGTGVATGGTIDSTLRFNGDSGTNYAYQLSLGFAAGSSSASATSIAIENGATDSGQMVSWWMEITQIQNKEKNYKWESISQDAAGGGTIPVNLRGYGKWANTANLINKISWLSSNLGAGSEVIVYANN